MKMRWIFKCILSAILFHGAYKFCYLKTSGFNIGRISSNYDFNPEWEVSHVNEDLLNKASKQKFSFLGSGGQCFAFVSEDDKYVIKFYKHDTARLPFFMKYFPIPKKYFPKREIQRKKRLKRLFRDFNSFKLSYEYLEKETALLYLHLNKTNYLNRKITIIDRVHISHTLDLDKMVFILQKKADLAYPYLKHLAEKKDFNKAKHAMQSICDLIFSRLQKGIYDEDAKIHRNFGFIQDHAILIDVGRLKFDEKRKNPAIQQTDLQKITKPFKEWLKKEIPEFETFLNAALENTYAHLENL